jgi:pyruvate/2-oxoglutarate dehydrogenase complex dihydrolipoamide acyltransferase (E2) component
MAHEVKLPDLGKDAPDKAEVSFWYVEVGEKVEEGQDMVEMVTDKAAFTVPSPASGTLKEIRVQEGEVAKVGSVLAVLE